MPASATASRVLAAVPFGASHSASDDRYQRDAVLNKHAVGTDCVADGAEDALLFALKHGSGKDDAERVDSRRHVLERDALALENRQNLTCKADLGVHHVLLDSDRGEAGLSGDSGNDIFFLRPLRRQLS